MIEARIILNLSRPGEELELIQGKEGKIYFGVFENEEDDAGRPQRRKVAEFSCDHAELMKALEKLPLIDKLINE